jgi:hypothetical protein
MSLTVIVLAGLPPLAIALGVLVFVALLGIVISLFRGKSTFSGYEELAEESRVIAKALNNAEVFKDGNDLVVSGNFQKLPTIVRFSYDENTPALNIHMKAPATFNMSVVPKGARSTEGRVLVRTPDDMFDARFTTRSDNPTQAKMFTGGKTVMQALQKVCCSSKTFFTVTPGAIELSELTMPQPYTGRHVADHISMMGALAKQLADMPGSETVKIHAMQREGSSWLVRGAVIVGAVAALVTVVAATREFGKTEKLDVSREATLPAGIRPADAAMMIRLEGWRVAEPSDFNPAGAGWMRGNGQEPGGRIPADFVGAGNATDSAYVLVNEQTGKKRIIMVGHGSGYYDVEFDRLDAVGLVRNRYMGNQPWAQPLSAQPDGDGLALVLDATDSDSGLIVYLNNRRLQSGKPSDYQRVRLN